MCYMYRKTIGRCGMNEDKMSCVLATDFALGWDAWREKFKDAMKNGRKFGLSDETIKSMSIKIGDFMATKICPKTKEEELMRELWTTATTEERKALASIIFRMVDK